MPFWVFGRKENGTPMLFGSHAHPNLAQDFIDRNSVRDGRVFHLATSNEEKATRAIKYILVRESRNVEQGTKQFRHPNRHKMIEEEKEETYLGRRL